MYSTRAQERFATRVQESLGGWATTHEVSAWWAAAAVVSLHGAATALLVSAPLVLPATSRAAVALAAGYAALLAHWRALGGCVLTPLENVLRNNGPDVTEPTPSPAAYLTRWLAAACGVRHADVRDAYPVVGMSVMLLRLLLADARRHRV